jgi:hypothetical protein
MINQWKNSIEWCEFIDEMSYTRRVVKTWSLFEDDDIKVQNLIRLSSTSCGNFLHQTMHLRDSTRLAFYCSRGFISLNHLYTLNFLQLMNHLGPTMTESKMPKSRRRFRRSEFSWLNRICMLNEMKFQQQHVAMHAYFAYFRVWFHMHQDVSMRITIITLLDETS